MASFILRQNLEEEYFWNLTSIEAQCNYTVHEQVQDEDFTIHLEISIGWDRRLFCFSTDEFIENDESPDKEELFYFLIESGINDDDADSLMIGFILLTCEARNKQRRDFKGVLNVCLRVTVIESSDQQQIQQTVEAQSLSEIKIGFKPASKLAIKSLSRRKFKKRGVGSKKCTICLTKFVVGVEMANLPCGHVFHDGCIVEWLGTSHLCPLCRLELPCEQESEQELQEA